MPAGGKEWDGEGVKEGLGSYVRERLPQMEGVSGVGKKRFPSLHHVTGKGVFSVTIM